MDVIVTIKLTDEMPVDCAPWWQGLVVTLGRKGGYLQVLQYCKSNTSQITENIAGICRDIRPSKAIWPSEFQGCFTGDNDYEIPVEIRCVAIKFWRVLSPNEKYILQINGGNRTEKLNTGVRNYYTALDNTTFISLLPFTMRWDDLFYYLFCGTLISKLHPLGCGGFIVTCGQPLGSSRRSRAWSCHFFSGLMLPTPLQSQGRTWFAINLGLGLIHNSWIDSKLIWVIRGWPNRSH